MALRLVPRDDAVLARLSGLAELALTGTQELGTFLSLEASDRRAGADRLGALEHEGLTARAALLRDVARSFVVPLDVEDVHAIATALTDCLGGLRSTADLAAVAGLRDVPDSVPALVRPIGRMAEVAVRAMTLLRSPRALVDPCIELDRLSVQAARAHATVLGDVWAAGVGTATEALKLKAFADDLHEVARAYAVVGRRVEVVALKGS